VTFSTTTIEHLYSTLVQSGGPDAVVLLGAGASRKSGILLSSEIVEQAGRWAWCQANGRHVNDPTVKRSDWQPWLQAHPWYRSDQSAADNYSEVIEYLLQPQEERKRFFLRIIRPGVPASPGYGRLVDLIADEAVRTVLTTNFDNLLPEVCLGRTRPRHVEVIKTPADYIKFSTFPPYPQCVYLHGSVEHYTDKNLIEEVQRLDEEMVRELRPLLRDHPLIVIGYRGAEPSIMRHLLIEQAASANRFRHGIFWCAMADSIPDGLHPLVQELADAIGNNLRIVPIEGFDETMERVWSLYEQRPRPATLLPSAAGHNGQAEESPAPTFDMQPVAGASLDELDWTLVQARITDYCRETDIYIPTPVTREWLVRQLCDADLAVRQDGQTTLTNAGYLLFARSPHEKVRSAQTVLHIEDQGNPVGGNLWEQRATLLEALDDINRPFRLKGDVSKNVYPYPPDALRELIVNALVHRKYDDDRPISVRIEPTHIRITNPGGLVEEVVQRIGLPIQEKIERGARGNILKGYRNPAIADLFYGAGAMDKKGSGLADVQKWVNENESKVLFGPTDTNSAFEVTIFRRMEEVDAVTGTASALVVKARYITNLLEVTELPQTVWHAPTPARLVKDVWINSGADKLPPFVVSSNRLLTFSDLPSHANPLSDQVDLEGLEKVMVGEFAGDEDGERLLVYLLNQCLQNHLYQRGMIIDKKRKRAYFPRAHEGPREITYKALFKRATRTVTKPIISRVTQKVRYWEHKAFRYRFERFGEDWALHILPGYVFTYDGVKGLLDGPRVTKLATRRASRDYNMQVHNDLYFWTWVLADGAKEITIDTGAGDPSRAGLGGRIVLRASPAGFEARDVTEAADADDAVLYERARDEMREIEDALARMAEAESSEAETQKDSKPDKEMIRIEDGLAEVAEDKPVAPVRQKRSKK
jgi:hypothetical protein